MGGPPAYETGPIFYLEIAALAKGASARANADAYLAALMPAIVGVGEEIVLIYDLCPLLRFREGGKAGMRSAGYITAGSFSPKRVCRLPSAS